MVDNSEVSEPGMCLALHSEIADGVGKGQEEAGGAI